MFFSVAWIAFAVLPATSNLLPNPDFAGADPAANVEDGWRWDPVVMPNAVRVNGDGSITVAGRKGFLRSPSFPTRQDTAISYEIVAEVRGKGNVRIETVWWDLRMHPASPHTEVVLAGQPLSDTPTRAEATTHPGPGAVYGQVRFVQESETDDGFLVIRQPVVTAVPRRFDPGELVLALDAANPGDAPAQTWQDLAGRNRPFRVMGAPEHDPEKVVYRIDSRDDYFECAAEDESRFDFDTARATGTNDPFTIVVYASLDGPSHGAFMNKLELRRTDPVTGAMLDAPGWMMQLIWGQFGAKKIEVHQMLNNLHDRIISRHGGEDGQSLAVNPGEMHLFVVHVPGDGIGGNVQAFVDGNRRGERNVPWPGGGLPKRSIKNNAPFRIGGGLDFVATGHPLFTGTIGFVEIWRGRGLLEGMTPEAYGEFRWNNGQPVRGVPATELAPAGAD